MAANDTTVAPEPPVSDTPVSDTPEPVTEPVIDEKPTLEQRFDRLEAAVAKGVGIDLSKFDGQEILSARAVRLAEAGEKAAEMVKDAFVEPALTLEQRVERLFKAVTTQGIHV